MFRLAECSNHVSASLHRNRPLARRLRLGRAEFGRRHPARRRHDDGAGFCRNHRHPRGVGDGEAAPRRRRARRADCGARSSARD